MIRYISSNLVRPRFFCTVPRYPFCVSQPVKETPSQNTGQNPSQKKWFYAPRILIGVGVLTGFYFLKNEREEFYDRDVETYEEMFKPYQQPMEEAYEEFLKWNEKIQLQKQDMIEDTFILSQFDFLLENMKPRITYNDGQYIGHTKKIEDKYIRHGRGIILLKNGIIYRGNFDEDFPNGPFLITDPNGTQTWKSYKEGKLEGLQLQVQKDGNRYLQELKEGDKYIRKIVQYKSGQTWFHLNEIGQNKNYSTAMFLKDKPGDFIFRFILTSDDGKGVFYRVQNGQILFISQASIRLEGENKTQVLSLNGMSVLYTVDGDKELKEFKDNKLVRGVRIRQNGERWRISENEQYTRNY